MNVAKYNNLIVATCGYLCECGQIQIIYCGDIWQLLECSQIQ